MSRFTGRTAIVTGAARGMGWEVAKRFADEGANVLAVDLPASEIMSVHAERASISPLAKDITERDAAQMIVDTAIERFGGFDILVNNAGIVRRHPLEGHPLELWNQNFNVNLTAMMLICAAAIPHLKTRLDARIVNFSSLNGLVPTPNSAAYVASKHGVIGLTKTLAVEVGQFGITANAVCPGVIDTPGATEELAAVPDIAKLLIEKTPMHRMGRPEDVARTVLFLCERETSFVTGQAIVVDGGVGLMP